MNEQVLRLVIFLSVFGLLFVLAVFFSFRKERKELVRYRFINNLILAAFNSGFAVILSRFALVAVSFLYDRAYLGVLERLNWPVWLEYLLSFLVLDIAVYWQHRLFHRVPVFWRLHQMHHTDPFFDLSTGLRFHTLEILISLLWKFSIVMVFGIPPMAFLVFEIILNSCSLFNHSNFRLPGKLEGMTRKFLVTPDFHRIHHSPYKSEVDSNYGFCLSLWDYLFNSYTAKARDGQENMQLGLSRYRTKADQRIDRLLAQPFLEKSKND